MGGKGRNHGIFDGGIGFTWTLDHPVRRCIGEQRAYRRYKINGYMPVGETCKARRSAWTQAQYKLLRMIAPKEPTMMDGSAFAARDKLRTLLGDAFLEEILGKTVIDFGCGDGAEAVEMAASGAERVTGLDIQTTLLARARQRPKEAAVGERCTFVAATGERSDIVTSIDAFEHCHEPEAALLAMYGLLKPGGSLVVSFEADMVAPAGRSSGQRLSVGASHLFRRRTHRLARGFHDRRRHEVSPDAWRAESHDHKTFRANGQAQSVRDRVPGGSADPKAEVAALQMEPRMDYCDRAGKIT
jgi:2-polyprenyl-3-methyl-5-hydroxy-6-metoxy-1,4-benzoquinol methylase